MDTVAFSPGKVIISGEHSVVYGQPAVVGGISLGISTQAQPSREEKYKLDDQYLSHIFDIFSDYFTKKGQLSYKLPPIRDRVQVHFPKLKVIVDSTLPQKAGLGSSAAFAHAVFLSLANFFNISINAHEMFELVWLAEAFIHTNSSGIDPAAVVFGGLLQYQKSKILPIGSKPFFDSDFVLIHSGQAEESTGDMVKLVADKPASYRDMIVSQIGKVTTEIVQQLNKKRQTRKFDYSLLSENQSLLEKLGVVGDTANYMVRSVEKIGGVAKITGAGGLRSGSGFLLCWHQKLSTIIDLAVKKNWQYRKLSLGV